MTVDDWSGASTVTGLVPSMKDADSFPQGQDLWSEPLELRTSRPAGLMSLPTFLESIHSRPFGNSASTGVVALIEPYYVEP